MGEGSSARGSQERLGHCSRVELHPCHESHQHDIDVRYPRRLDDSPDIDPDEGLATAWDYIGVLFTLFSIISVSALYMYSSSVTAQFNLYPDMPGSKGSGLKPSAAFEELKNDIAQLKAQQRDQRSGKMNDYVGTSGAPPCCADLREKLEMLFTKMRELNLDGMGKEIAELKETLVRMRLAFP